MVLIHREVTRLGLPGPEGIVQPRCPDAPALEHRSRPTPSLASVAEAQNRRAAAAQDQRTGFRYFLLRMGNAAAIGDDTEAGYGMWCNREGSADGIEAGTSGLAQRRRERRVKRILDTAAGNRKEHSRGRAFQRMIVGEH